MRADAMRLLHLMAVGAFGQGRRKQVIVRAPAVLPHLGMSSFWVRHCTTPRYRPARGNTPSHTDQGRILGGFNPEIYCFLSQSCFSRARGASRESLACVSHRHSSWFRLAPQEGHNPRQSLWQITFMGKDSNTCSFSTSARNRPSPTKKPISVSPSFRRSSSGLVPF